MNDKGIISEELVLCRKNIFLIDIFFPSQNICENFNLSIFFK